MARVLPSWQRRRSRGRSAANSAADYGLDLQSAAGASDTGGTDLSASELIKALVRSAT
ncbi:hypothetical protein [Rhodoplanes elegans]|uniref:hypothetical protein n=1 Tax=Rhodoplanes elegans TaxID=29408 RepID=UPI001474EFD4|nr:hypothetical protein [Rhodoplanes elegans]